MTELTDEAVKALLDEMTFAMFGDGTDDTISEKLARALLDARAELARVKADAAVAVAWCQPMDCGKHTPHVQALVAEAVAAERERCAAIAVRHWEGEPEDTIAMVAEIRAALAQTPTDPGDGWTWNERLGWIGPDGKPAGMGGA